MRVAPVVSFKVSPADKGIRRTQRFYQERYELRNGRVCFLFDNSIRNTSISCSLEFNIHQLILSDLAASVGASKDDPADPTIDSSIDLITSNVYTRDVSNGAVNGSDVSVSLEQRGSMVSVPVVRIELVTS